MDCTLMHKNVPVVELRISDYNGHIEKHGAVHNAAHLPLGTVAMSGKAAGSIVPSELSEWWAGRSIPASRDGIRDALEMLGVGGAMALLPKCCGLSLSDQYWICPRGSGLRWESVNFFETIFQRTWGAYCSGMSPQTARLSA